jgi:hypothetical protein
VGAKLARFPTSERGRTSVALAITPATAVVSSNHLGNSNAAWLLVIILTIGIAWLRHLLMVRVLNTPQHRMAFYFASAVLAGILLALT